MAIDTPQEPRTPRERLRGALDLRPRAILLSVLLPVVLTAGVLGGLKLESFSTERQGELQSLQQELKELDRSQGEQIRNTQSFDRNRFELEVKIEELQEQLQNQDGFLR